MKNQGTRNLINFVEDNVDSLSPKLRKAWDKAVARAGRNERGEINITALLVVILLACVAFIVLAQMIGPMSTANATVQAMTATDSGTVNTKMVLGLLMWLIPLGLGIALIVHVIKNKG
jgi:hypothetical protein